MTRNDPDVSLSRPDGGVGVLIEPTTSADLNDLSVFLTRGFGVEADAPFAHPDVLAWKFLDTTRETGTLGPPRSLLARRGDQSRAIVAHLGATLSRWRILGSPDAARANENLPTTLHMLDWLRDPASPSRSVGVSLMRRINPLAATQYGLGGTEIARQVSARAGYRLVGTAPLWVRVIQPWVVPPTRSWRERLRQGARAARDGLRWARANLGSWFRPRCRLTVEPVNHFSGDLDAWIDAFDWRGWPWCEIGPDRPPILTTMRNASRFNHALACPHVGAHVRALKLSDGTGLRAVVLTATRTRRFSGSASLLRQGRIVEVLADRPDPALWCEAVAAGVEVLKRDQVSRIDAIGGLPWLDASLSHLGFSQVDALELHLRDPHALLPSFNRLHLGPLEADYVVC